MNCYQRFERSACLPSGGIDEAGNTREIPNVITVKSFRQLLIALGITITAWIGLSTYPDLGLLMKITMFISVLTAINGWMSWGATIDWYNDDDIRYADKVGAFNAGITIILIPILVISLMLL